MYYLQYPQGKRNDVIYIWIADHIKYIREQGPW